MDFERPAEGSAIWHRERARHFAKKEPALAKTEFEKSMEKVRMQKQGTKQVPDKTTQAQKGPLRGPFWGLCGAVGYLLRTLFLHSYFFRTFFKLCCGGRTFFVLRVSPQVKLVLSEARKMHVKIRVQNRLLQAVLYKTR